MAEERAQLPPSPPGSIAPTGFDDTSQLFASKDNDSEDDDDALRMFSIVFESDSSDEEGRRSAKHKRRQKRWRKHRCVMYYITPEGECVKMTPFMSTWYNINLNCLNVGLLEQRILREDAIFCQMNNRKDHFSCPTIQMAKHETK
jgi:hypothetical protein